MCPACVGNFTWEQAQPLVSSLSKTSSVHIDEASTWICCVAGWWLSEHLNLDSFCCSWVQVTLNQLVLGPVVAAAAFAWTLTLQGKGHLIISKIHLDFLTTLVTGEVLWAKNICLCCGALTVAWHLTPHCLWGCIATFALRVVTMKAVPGLEILLLCCYTVLERSVVITLIPMATLLQIMRTVVEKL